MHMNTKNTSDKLLWGIVGGIALIIIASLLLLLREPEPVTYRTGNEPADVAHNYLTAIYLNEPERAYGYLSPELPDYPATATVFWTDLNASGYCPLLEESASMYAVEEASRGDNTAVVDATITIFYRGQDVLFSRNNNHYQNINSLILEQIDQSWYITYADQCWSNCWQDADSGLPCR